MIGRSIPTGMNRLILSLTAVLFFLSLAGTSYAQEELDEENICHSDPSEKAAKALEKGMRSSKYDVEQRIEFLREAWATDEDCFECLFQLGMLEFWNYRSGKGDASEAEEALLELANRCPNYRDDAWYALGVLALAKKNQEKALIHFEQYLDFESDFDESFGSRRDKRIEEVRSVVEKIEFELAFWKHQDSFIPVPISELSSSDDEFLPVLSPDGSMLFFTRKELIKNKGDIVTTESEIFRVSLRDSTDFTAGMPMESPFNTGNRYGGATISIDNREMFIAAINPNPMNDRNIDIYSTKYTVNEDAQNAIEKYAWGPLTLVENINSPDGWEAQPALSPDGKELYFARINGESIRDENGNPSMDIWVSLRKADGGWSNPTLLPAPINSQAHDKAPFLHPDGKTMYFASDRKPGGGGYDIWMSRRDENGNWEAPTNFGAPINTSGNEHGLVVSANGTEAFFSSNRAGTKGLDIISFPVPEEMKPKEVFILTGNAGSIGDSLHQPTRLYLKYAQSKRVQEIEIDRLDGHFASVVETGMNEDVLLVAEGDGFSFESQIIHDRNSDTPKNRFQASISSFDEKDEKPFEIGEIQFETNSYQVSRTSQLMLAEFAEFLNRKGNYTIKVMGHTDSQGNKSENQILSENRANAVAAVLIEHGIPPAFIVSEGYGDTKPLATNSTPEGRAQNRRTEFDVQKSN